MLTLCLILPENAPRLAWALPNLAHAVKAGCGCIVVARGTRETNLSQLQAFLLRTGGTLVRAEGSVTEPQALSLAAHSAQADSFLLPLTPQDRINLTGLEALLEQIGTSAAKLLALPRAFWLADPSNPLRAPETTDQTGATHPLRRLYPDPRQLVYRANALRKDRPQEADSNIWDAFFTGPQGAENTLSFQTPVLLQPLPNTAAGAAFATAQAFVAKSAEPDARLLQSLSWLASALILSPPEAAANTLDAAKGFLDSLPEAQKDSACSDSGPAGQLLAALAQDKKSEALAQLALLGQIRGNLISENLILSQEKLRYDVERALPGSDYLMELYQRTRGEI